MISVHTQERIVVQRIVEIDVNSNDLPVFEELWSRPREKDRLVMKDGHQIDPHTYRGHVIWTDGVEQWYVLFTEPPVGVHVMMKFLYHLARPVDLPQLRLAA